jgi:hypothetical protein
VVFTSENFNLTGCEGSLPRLSYTDNIFRWAASPRRGQPGSRADGAIINIACGLFGRTTIRTPRRY